MFRVIRRKRAKTTSVMMAISTLLFLLPCVEALSRGLSSQSVSLDDYLEQVMRSNQGYQGSRLSASASMQTARVADLLFKPQFLTSVEYKDDRAPRFSPEIEGIHTSTRRASVGFSNLTEFGFKTEFLYNALVMTRYGSSQNYVPDPSQFVSGIFFRFTQPIWQNGLGRMDREKRRAAEAQNQFNAYTASFQAKTLLADAETRYWRLVVARELVRLLRESADRALKLREFTARQLRQHLLDDADLLTAEAAVQGKALELKSAIDEERVAAQAFNSARNINSADVPESILLPSPADLKDLSVPARVEQREDVKAAEQAEHVASAGIEIERERLLPILELVGDTTFRVGINFVLPMDLGLTTSMRAAFVEQKRAAELAYQRRVFDQENEWSDVVKRFNEAKERLEISMKLVVAQRLKFEKEKGKKRRGITTVYKVLQYELDYLTSQLSQVQLEGLILGLRAQMKTFQGEP